MLMALQLHAATRAAPPRGYSPIAAGLLLMLAALFGRWLWGLLGRVDWARRGRQRGRWIRDRGLGGKMVRNYPLRAHTNSSDRHGQTESFTPLPHAQQCTASRASSGRPISPKLGLQVFVPEEEGPPPRLVSNTSTAGAASPASVSGRRAPADPWQTAAAKGLESEATPLWWLPPPSIYIDPSYKRTASFYAFCLSKQALRGLLVTQHTSAVPASFHWLSLSCLGCM